MHGYAPVYWPCKLAHANMPIDENESGYKTKWNQLVNLKFNISYCSCTFGVRVHCDFWELSIPQASDTLSYAEQPMRGNDKCIADSVAEKADEGDVLKKTQEGNTFMELMEKHLHKVI